MNDFSGWIPLRVYWRGHEPMVDWGHLGTRRFTDPFFAQTTGPCTRHPADVLFRHQTPLDSLEEVAATRPSVKPAGFIFHMSRCGSTLVSQMLAASPLNLVLSEAAPIDDVLRGNYRDPAITDEQRMKWFRAMVQVLSWQRFPEEQNAFIKFDCWHVMFLPLIRRVFPDVPWVFLYREPLEVMASAQMQLGGQMIPGVLDARIFGWSPETVAQMSLYEYAARVLAKLCETAHKEARTGGGKLVNYHQLPLGVWPALLKHWGIQFSEADSARMIEATRSHAKNPVIPFQPDSQTKREAVLPENRKLVGQWMEGAYRQLEAERSAVGFS